MMNQFEYKIKEGGVDSKIFIDRTMLDKGTLGQIKRMIYHPSVSHSRFMPDCHKGNQQCCVGFTGLLNGKIVPAFVGGDIGCGILTYNIGKIEVNLEDINNKIIEAVPMGSKSHDKHVITDEDFEWLFSSSNMEAKEFVKNFKTKFGKNISEFKPYYDREYLENKCKTFGVELDYVLQTMGTLGGGNHFIEFNKSSDDSIYVTIHCGSRTFGEKTCEYHQDKIDSTKRYDYKEAQEIVKKSSRKIKNSKILKKIKDEHFNKYLEAKHPDFLENEEAYHYLFDMIFAQRLSQLNRRIILRIILSLLNLPPHDENNVIESIHNYIDFEDFVIRKGAISAHTNKLCVVAFNMKDGILLCKGKGNSDWNYSCAHGSGRVLTRSQAKQILFLKDFQREMEGVYSTTVCEETLDESPMAYRDTEFIKMALSSTVEFIDHLKPILNIKALC